jgi:hypothetical protein
METLDMPLQEIRKPNGRKTDEKDSGKKGETCEKLGIKRRFLKMEALFPSELKLEILRIIYRVLLFGLLLYSF